mgnify:CR=1 FL=1
MISVLEDHILAFSVLLAQGGFLFYLKSFFKSLKGLKDVLLYTLLYIAFFGSLMYPTPFLP